MEEKKECFDSSTISDADLELILRERLKEDPFYYLDFLKELIDEIDFPALNEETMFFEEMRDEETGEIKPLPGTVDSFFELLKPSYQYRSETPSKSEDFDLIPSPEGVDMLFYPGSRKKIKEWQRIALDKNTEDWKRAKAEGNIQKVFDRIIYIGQGRPRALTPEVKDAIRQDYWPVYRECQKIFKEAKNMPLRKKLIKEKFPDVGDAVINDGIYLKPGSLRNAVLAQRYAKGSKSPKKTIKEFLRDERKDCCKKKDSP